jgi:hypothetical protein
MMSDKARQRKDAMLSAVSLTIATSDASIRQQDRSWRSADDTEAG